MAITVKKHETGLHSGLWVVADDLSGDVLATAKTNAAAWRAADKIGLEPIRPQEVAKDFVAKVDEHEEEQLWWSALLGLAYRKGRKRGWAAHVFRERFGKWPDPSLSDDFGPFFPAIGLFLAKRGDQ